jgi:hypothetical protein
MRKHHSSRARLVQYGAEDAFPGDLVIRRDPSNPDQFLICLIEKAGPCIGPFSTASAALAAALEHAEADGVAVWLESTDLAGRPLSPSEGVPVKVITHARRELPTTWDQLGADRT